MLWLTGARCLCGAGLARKEKPGRRHSAKKQLASSPEEVSDGDAYTYIWRCICIYIYPWR